MMGDEINLKDTECFRLVDKECDLYKKCLKVVEESEADKIFYLDSEYRLPLNKSLSIPEMYTSLVFQSFNPNFGRFNNGTFCVYYGALCIRTAIEEIKHWTIETAIEEKKHHLKEFFRATHEGSQKRETIMIKSKINGNFISVNKRKHPNLHEDNVYKASQEFAQMASKHNRAGIQYDSVRHKDGKNIAIFRQDVISDPIFPLENVVIIFLWDGEECKESYLQK